MCGRNIGDDLFSLTAGRVLSFHWRHGAEVDRSKWMKVLERENTVKKKERMKVLERENTMKKGEWKRCLCWKGRKWLEDEGNLP